MHTFYRGSCPESECISLWLMAAAVEKSREVLLGEGTFAEVVVPVPRKPVPVPQSRKSPVTFWYQYHTYWYRYQHVIFTSFEKNSNFGARARLSFDHHFKMMEKKGI